jgi:hypothetical protein
MAVFDEIFDEGQSVKRKEDESDGKDSSNVRADGEVKQAETQGKAETEGKSQGQTEQVATPAPAVPPAPAPSNEDRVGQAFSQERRKWQERAESSERQIAELAAQLKALQQPKAPEAKAPSFDEDPAGFLRHQQEEAIKRIEQAEQSSKRQTEAYERQRQQEHLKQVLGFKQAEFSAKNPDYTDAFLHWRKAEMTKLNYHPDNVIDGAFQELGYNPESATREQKIGLLQQHFELGEAARMLNMGINPAEMIYNMSRDVYGYRKAEAPKPNGATPPTTAAADKIALIQQGLAESGSLGGGAASTDNSSSADELGESLTAMRAFARKVNK